METRRESQNASLVAELGDGSDWQENVKIDRL
jgi:hypothetical protein